MSIIKVVKTGEFLGISSTRISYLINEFTQFIDVSSSTDTETVWEQGYVLFKLPTGEPVAQVNGDTYEIIRIGENITLTRSS